jgi:hypothetical protein
MDCKNPFSPGLGFRVTCVSPPKLGFFFWGFEVTYPPILKGSESNGAIKFPYTITIWKIWGGVKFQGGRIDDGIKG